MWYEILPSFGIVVIAMAVPHASAYVLNKLVVGNYFRRSILNKTEALNYLRDRRLTDDPYKLKVVSQRYDIMKGLEALPDI